MLHTNASAKICSFRSIQVASGYVLKRAEAVVTNLEAERAQLQATRAGLERNAVQAIQNAVRQQSSEIERQTVQAFAAPLRDTQQAAAQVRQNIKESNWLFVAGIFLAGLLIGLFTGYYFVIRTQNAMDDRLNRIEQYLSAPAQPVAAPTTPDPHASTHNGQGK